MLGNLIKSPIGAKETYTACMMAFELLNATRLALAWRTLWERRICFIVFTSRSPASTVSWSDDYVDDSGSNGCETRVKILQVLSEHSVFGQKNMGNGSVSEIRAQSQIGHQQG